MVELAKRQPCERRFWYRSCSQSTEKEKVSPWCCQFEKVFSGLDQNHIQQPELGKDFSCCFFIKAATDVVSYLILLSTNHLAQEG